MKINEDLSTQIADKYGHLIEKKHCYENVYRMAYRLIGELPEGSTTSVLYSYIFCHGYYLRHAFYVVDDEIVEPLLHLIPDIEVEKTITIAQYTIREYNEMLLADERFDLLPSLRERELALLSENEELAAFINPIDLIDIIREPR